MRISYWSSYVCTSDVAVGAHDGRILVGLTRPYAVLGGSALASLPPEIPGRVRIFGAGLTAHLPAALHPQGLHYDSRLDVLSPGTRLDGQARRLGQFVGLPAALPRSENRGVGQRGVGTCRYRGIAG